MQFAWRQNIKTFGIASVLVVEFLLFCVYFQSNIVPYYPRNWDQLATYRAVYQTYFAVRDGGVSQFFLKDNAIMQGAFKGWVVPFLGLVGTFLLGPQRLSIGLVNLFFFILGQIGLVHFFERRYGWLAGVLAWGLFLSGTIHNFFAGGIDDLRFDYAGMVIFGLAFLSLVTLLEKPTRRHLLRCAVWVGLGLATRSIIVVYLVGMEMFLFVLLAFQWFRKKDDLFWTNRVRGVASLVALSLLGTGFFLLANGSQLADYYGKLKVTPEDSIRQAEFGINSLKDWLFYYPRSARTHFRGYLNIAALSVPVFFLIWILQRLRGKATQLGLDHSRLALFAVTLGTAVLTIYTALTLYSPSPIVIGVLTIPLAATLANWLVEGFHRLGSVVGMRLTTGFIAAFGLASYINPMITPQYINISARREGETINQFLDDLDRMVAARLDKPVIYWMFPHPGLHPYAFEIYLYEHGAETLVPNLRHVYPTIFATTQDVLGKTLASSDIVVTYVQMPNRTGYEYPSIRSLMTFESTWREQLEDEFVLRQSYTMMDGEGIVGIFIRSGN
ncbi:MAG: hypothetical protein HY868_18355 [Chloroflexi bacterium]|nr:hypothetical protein [Chloroflexota bacterium]